MTDLGEILVREANNPRAMAAYRAKREELARLLERLDERLDAHAKERDGSRCRTVHWGHVGDLEHIASQLRALV